MSQKFVTTIISPSPKERHLCPRAPLGRLRSCANIQQHGHGKMDAALLLAVLIYRNLWSILPSKLNFYRRLEVHRTKLL